MRISVIVCTYSRMDDLRICLDSLRKQERSPDWDFDVLVVDNSPSGSLKEAVAMLQKEWPSGMLNYIQESKQGKSSALNTGIGQIQADIIAFTDDDVIADPRWLQSTIDAFNQLNCDGIGGRVLPVFPDNTAQWIKDNAVKLAGSVVIYDYGAETKEFSRGMYPFIGANYAFKKNVFNECGLFRPDLGPGMPTMGEDTEFIERLHAKGKKLFYCGNVLIMHPFDPKRMDLKHVARWHISLGKFDALREMQTGQSFHYIFGVPRYLLLGVIKDALKLVPASVQKMSFYNAWRSLFRKIGMIQAYRGINHQGIRHA